MRDMELTRDEVEGLMAGLVKSDEARTARVGEPTGSTKMLIVWAVGTCRSCGAATEGTRHRDRTASLPPVPPLL